MKRITKGQAVVLTRTQWDVICNVVDRLYDEKTISGDQRRDLANCMEANLNEPHTITIDDLLS